MIKKIIIGTRDSKLAVTQTNQVIKQLKIKNPNITFIFKKIKSEGDIQNNKDFKQFSNTGIFVKKLQNSLLKKKIDIAIHSLKDVPTDNNKKLILACFPKRKNPEDIILFTNFKSKLKFIFYKLFSFLNFKNKIIIGTSSERRKYQLKKQYPFCKIKALRGNIDTRINKLKNKQYDAIILANAGLERLSINHIYKKKLNKYKFIPAPAQGCLVIESLNNKNILNIINSINDKKTEKLVNLERRIMKQLEAGCQTPLGCYIHENNKYYFIKLFYYRNKYIQINKKIIKKNINLFISQL